MVKSIIQELHILYEFLRHTHTEEITDLEPIKESTTQK